MVPSSSTYAVHVRPKSQRFPYRYVLLSYVCIYLSDGMQLSIPNLKKIELQVGAPAIQPSTINRGLRVVKSEFRKTKKCVSSICILDHLYKISGF